jgi:hypothetical protein
VLCAVCSYCRDCYNRKKNGTYDYLLFNTFAIGMEHNMETPEPMIGIIDTPTCSPQPTIEGVGASTHSVGFQ